MKTRTDAGASHVTTNPRTENAVKNATGGQDVRPTQRRLPSALSLIGALVIGEVAVTLAIGGLCLLCAGVSGCAQETKSIQPTAQEQRSTAAQDQQGTNGRIAEAGIYVVNDASGGAAISNSGRSLVGIAGGTRASSQPSTQRLTINADGTTSLDTLGDSARVQVFVMPNNIGGSTTASQAGGAVSGQSSNSTATQTPTQHPEATLAATANIPVGPGSSAQGAANAAGQGSTATQTANATSELRTLLDKSKNGKATPADLQRIEQLQNLLFGGPPASQPTQP